jgi:hypothetical protein
VSLRHPHQKRPILLVWLGIVTLVVFCETALFNKSQSASSAIQQQDRVLHRLPVEKGEPIVILGIKVDGHAISFDQRFAANDDWLKSLVISIKNRSDKVILLVSLQLQFPRPTNSSDTLSLGDFYYGNSEILSRQPTAEEQLTGIAPGQIQDIHLSAERFEDFQSLLNATGYAASVKKVNFRIDNVIFKDDTMWSGGEHLKRDNEKLNTWIRIASSSVGKSGFGSFIKSTTAFNNLNWSRRFWSLKTSSDGLGSNSDKSKERPLFPRATRFTRGLPPQNTCWRSSTTVQLSCGVAGYTCTYDKDTLDTMNYGDYYLANASILCSGGSCGYHATQIKNQCASDPGGQCDPACTGEYTCFEGLCTDMSPIVIDISGNQISRESL